MIELYIIKEHVNAILKECCPSIVHIIYGLYVNKADLTMRSIALERSHPFAIYDLLTWLKSPSLDEMTKAMERCEPGLITRIFKMCKYKRDSNIRRIALERSLAEYKLELFEMIPNPTKSETLLALKTCKYGHEMRIYTESGHHEDGWINDLYTKNDLRSKYSPRGPLVDTYDVNDQEYEFMYQALDEPSLEDAILALTKSPTLELFRICRYKDNTQIRKIVLDGFYSQYDLLQLCIELPDLTSVEMTFLNEKINGYDTEFVSIWQNYCAQVLTHLFPW